MSKLLRIENLTDSNIDDLIYVCSSKRLDDPVHQQGIRLKKQWLREMLDKYGSVAKIAYLNNKPVAQILYYPETADKTKVYKRENVIVIYCIYNPTPVAQKIGAGTKLLQSLIQDVKLRKNCLGNRSCRFLLAKAFNTGEFLSLSEFYKKNGFLSAPENTSMHLPLEGSYKPTPLVKSYEPLAEDRNRAIVFYGPVCQFGYPFSKKIEEIIREIAPQIKIEMINEWEKPEEFIRRKNHGIVVNAKPIRTFFMETEKFKEEIRQALG